MTCAVLFHCEIMKHIKNVLHLLLNPFFPLCFEVEQLHWA